MVNKHQLSFDYMPKLNQVFIPTYCLYVTESYSVPFQLLIFHERNIILRKGLYAGNKKIKYKLNSRNFQQLVDDQIKKTYK